jgi:hypothetical protein
MAETLEEAMPTVVDMRKAEQGNERTFPSRQVLLQPTEKRGKPVNKDPDKPPAESAVHVVKPMTGLYTRFTDPFNTQRVQEILGSVTIGDDISTDQRVEVKNLIRQYADIFALSVSKVASVDFALFSLNMPLEATFNMAAQHRSFTQPQKKYLFSVVDNLQKAGVIQRIEHKDIRAVSLVTLPQKPHTGEGLPVEELLHRINDECIWYGLPTAEDLPEQPQHPPVDPTESTEPKLRKYQFCCNFNEVNQKARVPPFMLGDIKLK